MKTLIFLVSLTTAFSSFAASVDCKIEAHVAAAELFKEHNPNVSFFIRAKAKAVRQDKVIYQTVEITDRENIGSKYEMTVTLNANTCSVVSID